ncbi:hypothetical protein E4U42_006829 [Claviceps africana]|uniref:RBR-type E3 ubiquitin transferase n=1 Tax=Claviceps africana TaxID=83212 RepID=A0A8K0J3V8_9HYPO|nr:hypothetical protein E4U42_006829 [Claviceps africana]
MDDRHPPDAPEAARPTAGSSSAAKRAAELRRCVACASDVAFFETVRCPCSHDYCRDCMTELFSAAVNDESMFPPRCCRIPIPLDPNRSFLSAGLLDKYKAKEVEFATPNRTYCHVPACSAFVPPASVRGDVATCVQCQSTTCTICKGKSHSRDCPVDTSAADVLRIAAENGWQRCYSCGRLVDLVTGCNHITCRCKAEFCYVCGVKWKQCQCGIWDEGRLMERVGDVVDREARGRNARGEERQALLDRMRRNLIRNHECEEHRWEYLQGKHRCEECGDRMPMFIYECRFCHIMACRRCRYNRL